MKYRGKCGSCDYFEDSKTNSKYDDSQASYVKGFCTWYRSFYYPDDSCSNHYRIRGSSTDCYITTMLCNKLGFEDDSQELNVLRSFRDNVLQKDSKYKGILYEYDYIGPMIAKELQKEDDSFIKNIYNSFIVPVVNDLQKEEYDNAIQKYSLMTRSLQELYGISSDVNIPNDYSYTEGGHGKVKSKRVN